ncbi:MAG: hypothetical protein Q9191_004063 [Dirinaria sp. TL-2023a]
MNIFQAAQPSLLDRAWAVVRYPYNLVKNPFEAFLSIPALSFLIIPTFSSYSTSLNLLFFYLTWSTLILSNPPLKVEVFGTLAIRVLFYILPSLGFLAFDSAAPKVAIGIKEHGEDALPLSDEPPGKMTRWWKIALVSIANTLLGVALQAGVELLFTQVLHIRSALKVTTSIPMPWSIALDLLKGLLLREVLSYLLHRYALHHPSSPLTNYHMSWQHSVSPPYSLVANYDFPLAYLVRGFLPAYLPALLFRFHLLTYHLYLAIISLEETFAYSGYNVLPSAFILGGIARRTERHLMGEAEGNFGCFGFMDFALGTSLGQDLADDVRDEVEEEIREKKGKGVGSQKQKKKSRERKAIQQAKDDGEQAIAGSEERGSSEMGENDEKNVNGREEPGEEQSKTKKRGNRRRARS